MIVTVIVSVVVVGAILFYLYKKYAKPDIAKVEAVVEEVKKNV